MKRLLTLLLTVTFAFTGLGVAVAQDATPVSGGPIKIGVLNPTTGSFAVFGEQVNAGIQLYFDSIDNTVAGVPVELVFADTAGDPQQALDQARRLIGEEQVDLLMGIVNSAVVPPIAELAASEEIPLILSVGGAQVATGPDRSPYVFRTALANGQQDRVLGWYAATAMGKKNAATFAWDFIVGEERVGGFADTFTAAGGTIVTEQKPPLGTTDYGPFIGQVDPTSIDVAYAFFAGPGALAFAQQMADFGLTPNVSLVASDYFTAGILQEMGDTALGLVQAGGYTASIDSPENAAYLEAFQASGQDRLPGTYDYEGYLSAMIVAGALEAAGGIGDEQAFLDALAATDVVTPAGQLTFDDHGQAVRTIYITEVQAGDDGPVQAIIDTVEGVDQNWVPAE
ncbi:MAG TPA: ABC transporter substrate-binding protein [Thermomicrobiales bacterium]|nr:ABC transporter substrate-binding protein [Thermomicrobiales bacterium]